MPKHVWTRLNLNFRKAKKSGSNVFALFSQRQIQEFKEAFGIMDADKDGLLSSGDIVAAFNSVGKSVSDGEAQGMLSEAPGPVNFTQMVMLFAEKMAGGKYLFYRLREFKQTKCSAVAVSRNFLFRKLSIFLVKLLCYKQWRVMIWRDLLCHFFLLHTYLNE